MNTSLAPRFGAGTGLMSREDLAKSLNNAALTMPRVGGDKQFLKMDKGNGDWLYGQEETVVEDDSLWAVNPMSLLHGYISWDKNQQVEGELMVPISRDVPSPDSLKVQGSADGRPTGQNGWQFQMSVDMVCINGDDAGTVIQYKQSSAGAMKAFRAIVDAIGGQIEGGKDEIVPVVQMKADSYKHKKYGKIFNPIFEIVEWRTMDDTSPADGKDKPEPEPVKEEPPARTRTRTAAPPPPDKDAEEAELAKEYETAAASAEQAPRRRQRR